MAKYLAQIIVIGAQAVARAFTRALKQEIEASQRAAQQRSANTTSEQAASNSKLGITVQEAMQILNIESNQLKDIDLIEKRYKHLFEVNDKAKGGSFYLQSKVMHGSKNVMIPKLNGLINNYRDQFNQTILGRPSLVTMGRCNFSTSKKIPLEELEQIVSEENILQCIKRLEGLTLLRIKKDTRKASIFIPFCHNKENVPSLLFCKRSFLMSKHKGEVCFPGGMEEEEDSSVIESAIRETIEEIGVARNKIKIYGNLNAVGFNEVALSPVLGYLNIDHNNPNEFKLNPDEVESIHFITIEDLLDKDKWFKTEWRSGFITPVFLGGQNLPRIWGMTASILYILLTNLAPNKFPFDSSYLFRNLNLTKKSKSK